MSEAPAAAAPRKLVIVGRDEAFWLALGVLRSAFHPDSADIVAIELPSRLQSTEVIATLRNQQAFHAMLRLKEEAVLATTHGTFSLGRRFVGFGDTPFMHAYGGFGTPLNRVRFHQYWVKARKLGLPVGYDNFSLNAVAAIKGRFFVPDHETDAVLECDYAYHFDAVAYAGLLKQITLTRGGFAHVAAPEVAVTRDAAGGIASVRLPDGQTVTGDLFIDATGPESLLLGQAMQTPFESWAQWLPCNRILTASAGLMQPLLAFSQVTACPAGWAGMVPLRNRTAVQMVYRSDRLNDADASAAASSVTNLRLAAETHIASFETGRRNEAWVGNCVGIGEAAAVFDPIDNVGLQGIMLGLAHLTSLLPLDGDMTLERKTYNTNMSSNFDRIRDYQICHYLLNRREGDPMWDHCRTVTPPDRLAYKLRLFGARGHLVEYDDETFADYDWHGMLIGHGLVPNAWDPLANEKPDGEIIQHFQNIQDFIKTRVLAMKPMDAYLP